MNNIRSRITTITQLLDALPSIWPLLTSEIESLQYDLTQSLIAENNEQKRGMMADITQALVKNLGVDAEAVVIQINEAPLSHKMKGGKTFVERKAAAK